MSIPNMLWLLVIIFLVGFYFGRLTVKRDKELKPAPPQSLTPSPPLNESRNGYDRPYVYGDAGYIRGVDD